MLSTHIESQIYNNFSYVPTNQQKKIIKSLALFVSGEDSASVFVLNGFAGTGKTTIIATLSKVLNALSVRTYLLAPTGRAAKVISNYANKPALTIHKKIYRQKSATDNSFVLSFNKDGNAIYIIDEASMISNSSYENIVFGSGRVLDDIFDYVNSGRGGKIIFIGDTAQLPPIGTFISPALDVSNLEHYANVSHCEMNEVVRQELDSGILYNATIVRKLIEQGIEATPKFDLSFDDFQRIDGGEVLEIIEDNYNKFGTTNCLVIVRSNKQANRFNQGIRARVLYQEEMIESGDYLMVVKNNYFYDINPSETPEEKSDQEEDFIANGDVAQVVRIRRYEEIHGFRFANVTLRLIYSDNYELDCKILLDTLESESPSLSQAQQQLLFNSVEADYKNITIKRDRYKAMKADPYLNALQVKFAYAVTCHKAQGGQWDSVIIDRMLWGDQVMSIDLLRWLYTAITRATKKLYLLNFDDSFFQE